MKIKSLKKLNIFIIMIAILIVLLVVPMYCLWGVTDKGGIYWVEQDGTIAIDGWRLIDEDNDGTGYYYYFNKNGFIAIDDITPDYKIVGLDGKRLDNNGKVEEVKIEKIDYNDMGDVSAYSAEILAQIKANEDVSVVEKGVKSSGQYIFAKDPTLTDGPSPADGIIFEDTKGQPAKYILGPNVVLKNDKKSAVYDTSMKKEMTEYIKSGDKYSKKVNGTIFNKSKWKDVMALKGTGASIVFTNPKNNFNKLKGRIATHYFSYSDRTTQCTLSIYNEDDGEELFTTNAFNYNGGVSFECNFPRKASAVRFELDVTGQYTSRVCYLRNCEFGFDREAWEEEKYDDEVEEEYRRRVGTISEAEYYDDQYYEELAAMGEISVEGEDPGARYRRLNNINDDLYWATFNYDEEDADSISAEMKASISEARKKLDAIAAEKDKVSGPAFDPKLIEATEPVGPDGSKRIIEGREGG